MKKLVILFTIMFFLVISSCLFADYSKTYTYNYTTYTKKAKLPKALENLKTKTLIATESNNTLRFKDVDLDFPLNTPISVCNTILNNKDIEKCSASRIKEGDQYYAVVIGMSTIKVKKENYAYDMNLILISVLKINTDGNKVLGMKSIFGLAGAGE